MYRLFGSNLLLVLRRVWIGRDSWPCIAELCGTSSSVYIDDASYIRTSPLSGSIEVGFIEIYCCTEEDTDSLAANTLPSSRMQAFSRQTPLTHMTKVWIRKGALFITSRY